MLTGCLWLSIEDVCRWWRWAFQHKLAGYWLDSLFCPWRRFFTFTTSTALLRRFRSHWDVYTLNFLCSNSCWGFVVKETGNLEIVINFNSLSIWTHFHSIFHSKFLEGNSIHINETAFGFRSNGGFTLLWKFYIVIHFVLHSAWFFFDVFRTGIF